MLALKNGPLCGIMSQSELTTSVAPSKVFIGDFRLLFQRGNYKLQASMSVFALWPVVFWKYVFELFKYDHIWLHGSALTSTEKFKMGLNNKMESNREVQITILSWKFFSFYAGKYAIFSII